MEKKKILKFTAGLGLFIFALNILATIFYWYYALPWFDLLMHFLGGFFIAGLTFYLINNLSNFFALLALVLIVGLGWEIFEVLVYKFFGTQIQNLNDSLGDLLADLVGGAVGFFYFQKKSSAV